MNDYVLGVDEVGTGAWAGPFVVCIVRVPFDWSPPGGLHDSKKLTPARRAILSGQLLSDASLTFCLQQVSPQDILRRGQGPSWDYAVTRGVTLLSERVRVVDTVVDGSHAPVGRAEPRADGRYPAVMAASIIGKVFRDTKMDALHARYPLWGFDKNKGYGTAQHISAIERHGLSAVHRTTIRYPAVCAVDSA